MGRTCFSVEMCLTRLQIRSARETAELHGPGACCGCVARRADRRAVCVVAWKGVWRGERGRECRVDLVASYDAVHVRANPTKLRSPVSESAPMDAYHLFDGADDEQPATPSTDDLYDPSADLSSPSSPQAQARPLPSQGLRSAPQNSKSDFCCGTDRVLHSGEEIEILVCPARIARDAPA